MDEHRTGEGGAANMPPFPRLDDSPAEPIHAGETEISEEPKTEPRHDSASAGEHAAFRAFDEPAPASNDPTDGSDFGSAPFREPPPRSAGYRARDEVRRRAAGTFQRGFEGFADRLDDAAQRIEQIADEQLHGSEVRQRAHTAAQATAGWMGDFSDYLREADLDAIRIDIEQQVRDHPLRSLAIAVGAGWLLGKVLR